MLEELEQVYMGIYIYQLQKESIVPSCLIIKLYTLLLLNIVYIPCTYICLKNLYTA